MTRGRGVGEGVGGGSILADVGDDIVADGARVGMRTDVDGSGVWFEEHHAAEVGWVREVERGRVAGQGVDVGEETVAMATMAQIARWRAIWDMSGWGWSNLGTVVRLVGSVWLRGGATGLRGVRQSKWVRTATRNGVF